MKVFPVSVSMTPAFFDTDHLLLRTQLKCLSVQTCKDFDVWLIDPHYQKRKSIVPALAERFKLDIKHVPYKPNMRVSKMLDCAIFNAAYCYSRSQRNVRYSCYRFVRPAFIQAIYDTPSGVNTDFHMLAVGPDVREKQLGLPFENHRKVWDFDGEDVHWEHVPLASGYRDDGTWTGSEENSLGNWRKLSDIDCPEQPVSPNLYGNIAWNRDQWLAINGTNEVMSNSYHCEDLDFDFRAGCAGHRVIRRSHLMYRLHHVYGNHSQRSNIEVDHPFSKPCGRCVWLKTNTGDADYGQRLFARVCNSEIDFYCDIMCWCCNTCHLSGPILDDGGLYRYFAGLRARGVVRSPTLIKQRIGRDLSMLSDLMDRSTTLAGKVEIFNNSWDDQKFYHN